MMERKIIFLSIIMYDPDLNNDYNQEDYLMDTIYEAVLLVVIRSKAIRQQAQNFEVERTIEAEELDENDNKNEEFFLGFFS